MGMTLKMNRRRRSCAMGLSERIKFRKPRIIQLAGDSPGWTCLITIIGRLKRTIISVVNEYDSVKAEHGRSKVVEICKNEWTKMELLFYSSKTFLQLH